MVLVALDHVANACDERGEVAGIAAELVVVRVRLDVRLVDDVEAEPVAEVEPVGVVGVVRAADGVEVRLLDQPRVRLHQLARDCSPRTSSWSWRLTPWIRTAFPLTSRRPSRISTRRKPTRQATLSRVRRAPQA